MPYGVCIYDRRYAREREPSVCYTHILREASALSVRLQWAIPEPLIVERATDTDSSRFFYKSITYPRRGVLRHFTEQMKRIAFLILTVFACVAFAGEAMAAGKKVAVYVEGDMSKSDKSIVNSAVLARLSGNKDYTAFERNTAFINALNKEQDFQLSGEVSEKDIRAIGERMGVDYVIVINAVISDDDYCHMSARLIELVSGEILKSVNLKREYTDSGVLSTMANNVAYRLINKKSK